MQQWIQESLRRRLHKSLSCDWIHPERAHHFSLREFYVQLDWEKNIRHALKIEKVTLTSIHELIKQVLSSSTISSVIIEGKSHLQQKRFKRICFVFFWAISIPESKTTY